MVVDCTAQSLWAAEHQPEGTRVWCPADLQKASVNKSNTRLKYAPAVPRHIPTQGIGVHRVWGYFWLKTINRKLSQTQAAATFSAHKKAKATTKPQTTLLLLLSPNLHLLLNQPVRQ